MNGLSWGLVGAVGQVVLAPGWSYPSGQDFSRRRFVLGELLWGTSSTGVGQQLFEGMHGFASPTQHLLEGKRLAASWPCCLMLDGCGDPVWRVTPRVTSAVLG